ncbi:sugar-binding protein, partial [Bacteroidota bacterium]
YFDMDNSKIDAAGGYDANDKQLGFIYGADYSGILNGAVNAMDWKTGSGWAIEIAIPWDSLMDGFNPAVDMIIGYDVQAIDNDGGNRESKLATMALEDQGWTNPAYVGEMKFLADHKTQYIYPASVPWSAVTAYKLENSFYDDPADAADFSASAKMRWDDDFLHVHIDVSDDSLNVLHNNSWERDMVELYFDLDNFKQDGAYDDNDKQLGFIWDTDNSGVLNGGAESTMMETETGWAIDISVAWDSIMDGFTPAEGAVIGFDVQAIDNDGANRESKLAMMAKADEGWQNISYIGELQFGAGGKGVAIMPTTLAWGAQTGYALENSFYDDPADAADFSVTAKTKWDDNNIYVYVAVTDDSLDVSHTNDWERDKVELYFDMDNSKQDVNNGYDANDVQLGFNWNTDNSGVLGGAAKSKQRTTATGWILQVEIPWDSLMSGFTPAVDGVIGYDVQAIDNDGANRESKLSLMAFADEGWQNISYIGELKLLADSKSEPIYKEPVVLADVTFNVDVNGLIDAELFTAGTDMVDVAGSFNNWGDPVMNLSDDDSDGIYSVTVTDLPLGEIKFKFRINGDWDFADGPNGGADRAYTVVEGENVVNAVFNDGDYSPWVGVERYAVSNVHMYPNPARTVLHIDNTDNVQRIDLVNLVGQVTATHTNAGSSNLTLSVEDQKAGIYMIRFTSSDNVVSYQKLIIE